MRIPNLFGIFAAERKNMSDFYEDMVHKFFLSKTKHEEAVECYKRYGVSECRNSIWTCCDGTKVRIKDMTLTHIKNTIKLLERKEPDNDALKYLRYEVNYREEYPMILKELEEEERISDLCL